MEINLLGIDLAKDIFQLHGVDAKGRVLIRRKVRRNELIKVVEGLGRFTIAMEACSTAHWWAREFMSLGYEVKLIAPQFVKPFVKTNKNDANDAEAIAEAALRPSMRFVAVKQKWQLDLQAQHRVRARLVRNRTALSNEIRGFLQENGVILPKAIRNLEKQMPSILDGNHSGLSTEMRELLEVLWIEFNQIQQAIEVVTKRIERVADTREDTQRLKKVRGVGPLISTAVVAAAGDGKAFKNGRQFAAWLGLVPGQHSSGGKNNLLGISKRGDIYLRYLLIHGARAVVKGCTTKQDPTSRWVMKKVESRGYNRASVALANKTARILWALMSKSEEYRAPMEAA